MTQFADQPHWQSFELLCLAASSPTMWQGRPAEGLGLLQLRRQYGCGAAPNTYSSPLGFWLFRLLSGQCHATMVDTALQRIA